MDEQRQDQLEPIRNNSIQDIALKTDRKWWTIGKGGKRGPGRSVLAAQRDDDDDDDENKWQKSKRKRLSKCIF